MKILTAEQIHKLDAYTIDHEPIPSIHLMERAAESCVEWLWKELGEQQYSFFCGTGNNGGDGLAMARHFSLRKYDCEVYVLGDSQKGSDDFKTNLSRLEETDCRIYYLNSENHLFTLPKESLIVDCIFGSGLNRPVEGWRAKIIERLNKSGHRKIAIDIPSGLFADPLEQQDDCCLEADITLTFQVPKRAFLFRENEKKVGRVIVRDIGLNRKFHDSLDSDLEFTDLEWAKSVYRDRSHFSHKGTFGHLVICGGSKGKIGAVTLAAKSALRSGVGLVTALIPEIGYTAFQQSVPTAMCLTSGGSYIVDFSTDIEPEVIIEEIK